MTIREIKQCAYLQFNVIFTNEEAQNVIDTKPDWIDQETVFDAVSDYLNAFGK